MKGLSVSGFEDEGLNFNQVLKIRGQIVSGLKMKSQCYQVLKMKG